MPVPNLPDACPPALRDLIRAALEQAQGSGLCRIDLNGAELPAACVRWLLLMALPALDGHVARLEVWRAVVAGTVGLAGQDVKALTCFAGCTLDGLDLTDAKTPGLEVIGGQLAVLRADRLDMAGTLLPRGARADPTWRHDLPPGVGDTVAVPRGVLLSGAKIHGNLDLRGAQLGPVGGLPQQGHLALLADGLELDGNALISDGFSATGEVRLNGARIKRNLDAAGATLHHPQRFSLSAAGAQIDGTVYLGRRYQHGPATRAIGTLRLEGARIGGDLDARGGSFTAPAFDLPHWARIFPGQGVDNGEALYAVLATAITVSASVLLGDGFAANGIVWFQLAHIGGALDCSRGQFHFPGEVPFGADGASVAGRTSFDGARSDGLLRMVQAQLQQGLDCSGLQLATDGAWRGWFIGPDHPLARELEGQDVCGLYLPGADIGGSFVWRAVTCPPLGAAPARVTWMSAPRGAVAEVDDDVTSWDAVSRIDVRDTAYTRLATLVMLTAPRLRRLDQEYARWNARYGKWVWAQVFRRTLAGEQHSPDADRLGEQIRRFTPTPYLQLANVLRAAGFDAGAQEVLLRLERNRTHYSGRGVLSLLWRWLLDLMLRYGQAPFRPVLLLLIWVLLSGWWFQRLYEATPHTMFPDKSAATTPALPGALRVAVLTTAAEASGKQRFQFNGWFYAADTLVPFIDLGQKKAITISPPDSAAGWLLLVNTIFGYAASAFFAAGLSGLVRTGKDG